MKAILNHPFKLKNIILGYKFQMRPPFPLQINNFKNTYFYMQKISIVSSLSQD